MLVLPVLHCKSDPFGLQKAKAVLLDDEHHESVLLRR
jgi:hypothetical protein